MYWIRSRDTCLLSIGTCFDLRFCLPGLVDIESKCEIWLRLLSLIIEEWSRLILKEEIFLANHFLKKTNHLGLTFSWTWLLKRLKVPLKALLASLLDYRHLASLINPSPPPSHLLFKYITLDSFWKWYDDSTTDEVWMKKCTDIRFSKDRKKLSFFEFFHLRFRSKLRMISSQSTDFYSKDGAALTPHRQKSLNVP